MAAQRAANQEEVHLTRRRLNYKQFCDLQSESRRDKEKIEEKKQEALDNIREEIGNLKFNESSPEIREICDSFYKEVRGNTNSHYAKNR